MPISAQSWCLALTYQRLPGSSPTSTVPRPGDDALLAQHGDPPAELGLDRRQGGLAVEDACGHGRVSCHGDDRAQRCPLRGRPDRRPGRRDPAGDDRPVLRAGRDAGRPGPVRRPRRGVPRRPRRRRADRLCRAARPSGRRGRAEADVRPPATGGAATPAGCCWRWRTGPGRWATGGWCWRPAPRSRRRSRLRARGLPAHGRLRPHADEPGSRYYAKDL